MFKDENGKTSAARVFFGVVIFLTMVVVLKDTFSPPEAVEAPYTFLTSVLATLAAWAGVPRAVQTARR